VSPFDYFMLYISILNHLHIGYLFSFIL